MTDTTKPANPLVIYHGGCPDGFCAAWVAHTKLGEVDLHPVGPEGGKPPNVIGRDVYVLDMAYDRTTMEQMHSDAASLVVLDHHATNQDALAGLAYCTFDNDESGASLAWKHFFPDEGMPWLVQYVRDRDLRQMQMPDWRAVAAVTMSMQHNFEAWDRLAARTAEDAIHLGKGIRDHIDHYISAVISTAFPVQLGEHTVAAVCVAHPNVSDVLDALVDASTPIAMGFYWNKDRWQYSLRSRGDFDVSVIAKRYRGGGHKNMAGFTSGCILISEVQKAMVQASMRTDAGG